MNGPAVKNDVSQKPASATTKPSPATGSRPSNTNSTKAPAVNGNLTNKEPRSRSPNASARMATEKLRQEAAALQKRVAQFRAENQSFKAKIKRLEDECGRKTRQLEKLTQTAKDKMAAAQEQRKGDEALKQKCARLEMQLREKEDKLKKLQNAQQRRSSETATPERQRPSKSRLASSQPRGSSAELVKLREQMDRISQENRRLSLQLKEKDQEIRRLKSQLQPAPARTPVKTPAKTTPRTPVTNQRPRPAANSSRTGSATVERKNVVTAKRSNTFSVTRGAPEPDDKMETSAISVESKSTPNEDKPVKQASSTSCKTPEGKGAATPNASSTSVGLAAMAPAKPKPAAAVKPTRSGGSLDSSVPEKANKSADIKIRSASLPLSNPKAETLRRNVAAKKIQRVWRSHKKEKNSKQGSRASSAEMSQLSETSQHSISSVEKKLSTTK